MHPDLNGNPIPLLDRVRAARREELESRGHRTPPEPLALSGEEIAVPADRGIMLVDDLNVASIPSGEAAHANSTESVHILFGLSVFFPESAPAGFLLKRVP